MLANRARFVTAAGAMLVGLTACRPTAVIGRLPVPTVPRLGAPVTVKVTGSGRVTLIVGQGGLSGAHTNQTSATLPYSVEITDDPSEVFVAATTAAPGQSQSITCEIDAPGRPPVTNTSTGPAASVSCQANA